jgi:uncharacterized membrane protein
MNKTSMGLDENVACLLCYLFGWISGLIIFLIEKDNKLVRFHAAQSMVVFGALSVFQVVFGYGFLFGGGGILRLVYLAAMVLWIFLMVKAWNREYFKLPVVGDIAENISKNVKL